MKIQLLGKQLFFIQWLIVGSVVLAGCGKTPEEQYAQGNRYYKGLGVELILMLVLRLTIIHAKKVIWLTLLGSVLLQSRIKYFESSE